MLELELGDAAGRGKWTRTAEGAEITCPCGGKQFTLYASEVNSEGVVLFNCPADFCAYQGAELRLSGWSDRSAEMEPDTAPFGVSTGLGTSATRPLPRVRR